MGKTHTEILNEIHAMREPELKVPKGIADRKRVVSLIKEIQVVLLPGYFNYNNLSVEAAFDCVVKDLDEQAGTALCFSGTSPLKAKELTQKFLESLPEILRQINTDIQAIYDGDPAAKTKSEVIICYPGFYAISIYRIAHVMYKLGIPYLPRIMTEYAHEKTGIDINPGATIGEYFDEMILFTEALELEDCVYYAWHPANITTVRGHLPEDKDAMMAQIRRAMKDSGMLKDERFRAL